MDKLRNNHIKNIIDYLTKCAPGNFDNFSDVLIYCSDGQISCHKLVLASISTMLYREFMLNIWDENVSIIVPDFTVQEVRAFIESVYKCQNLNKFADLAKLFGCEKANIDEDLYFDELSFKEEICNEIDDYQPVETSEEIINNSFSENDDSEETVKILISSKEFSEVRESSDFVWRFFKLKAKSSTHHRNIVNCLHCDSTISIQKLSNTVSLKMHLFSTHPDLLLEKYFNDPNILRTDNDEKENLEDRKSKKISGRERSFVWDNFTKVGNVNDKDSTSMKCNFCGQIVKFKGVNNTNNSMRLHLLTKHFEQLDKADIQRSLMRSTKMMQLKSEKKVGSNEPRKEKKIYKKGDRVWKYFIKCEDEHWAWCQICEKKYANKIAGLILHVNQVHDKLESGPIPCEYCGKTFDTERAHGQHVYRSHTRSDRYECDVCFKTFLGKAVFRRHIMIHGGVKAFQCNVCGKRFLTEVELKSHTRVHTGETPFECPTCLLKFRFRSTLKNHKCGEVEDKPFECEKCFKKFKLKKSKTRHKLKCNQTILT